MLIHKVEKLSREEISNKLESIISLCKNSKGKTIICDEYICYVGSDQRVSYNRHLATHTRFSFILEDAMARFSGFVLMIFGEESHIIEIFCDKMINCNSNESGFVTMEKLSNQYVRVIQILIK